MGEKVDRTERKVRPRTAERGKRYLCARCRKRSPRPVYHEGLARRDELMRAADALFVRHDLWMLPVSPGVAIRRQRPGRAVHTAAGPVPYSRYLGQYLCPTAAIGTPALVVP